MPIVYVARHGQTDSNVEGRYQGQRESQLTQLGRRQAGALAEALGQCSATRVIASPLARCVGTAEPLATALGVELETDRRLIDIAHGAWEGRLRSDLEREDADRMRAWHSAPHTVRFPQGETLADVDVRWRSFARSLQFADADVAIVTHDELVRLAILAATSRPLAKLWEPLVVNAGYAVFEVDARGWRLVEECRSAHLGDLFVDPRGQAL